MLTEMRKPCWLIECDVCAHGDAESDACYHHETRDDAIDSGQSHGFVVDSNDGFAVCDECVYDRFRGKSNISDAEIIAMARDHVARVAKAAQNQQPAPNGGADA